ncbi:ELMO domain-containing protein 3, variant 2 [Chamberlinius hualienensis]
MSKTAMVFRFLWGPPTLNPILVDERNLIFAIAACPLQTAEEFQMRVLQTIYKKLCNSKFSAPRYGSHWEDIGFQGSDPATDLRGVGVWGLMNLLYMLMCPEAFPLALSIYRLSQHEIQHFPFAIMSLNISAIVLKVLREERLNKICNRRKQVAIVVNDLYVAAFRYLFTRWKNDRKTVFDSGYILRELEDVVRKHPHHLLNELHLYWQTTLNSDSTQPLARFNRSSKRKFEFSELFSVKELANV